MAYHKKALLSDEKLYTLLLDGQYLQEKDLQKARESAASRQMSLQQAILETDLLSDENLGKVISEAVNLPFIELSKIVIPEETLRIIPEIVAKKHEIVAFGQDEKGLKVATPSPPSPEVLRFISLKTGSTVVLHYCTPKDFQDALNLYKKGLQKSFDELLSEQIGEAGTEGAEAPIVKIVQLLIEYAYDNKASDIHVEPVKNDTLVRFRIDGVLHDVLRLPKPLEPQILTRIKVLSKLRTDEHMSAQDGKMKIKLESGELDIRTSVVPVTNGEKCVMRLLSSHSRQFSLQDLGMNEQDLAKVRSGFAKPYGMILSTGPTGSGKTTTIYAILKILNTREKNIATIEDPVEYDIEGINQIQVNPDSNLTFAHGLRSILRQDPDIVFVGEIRDEETADIAVNAAMTGHLVLSTLHTNDAAASLPRLIEMDVEPYLVSSTVNVIVAQRLVRKICEKCRVSQITKTQELSAYFSPELLKTYFGEGPEVSLYVGKGCPVCHMSGYLGRIGVFEVLQVTPAIEELINQKASASEIMKTAVKEGMVTMMKDGLEKIQQGITTLEEVLRVTKE